MSAGFLEHLQAELDAVRTSGMFKSERPIHGAQGAIVKTEDGRELINLCANNYLGLADHPAVRGAAVEAIESRGFGMASVRFICGTQDLHRALEEQLSGFLGLEDTILYPSCFDANGGLFETLLTDRDAIISDELNHASIIDGIRLCKAHRYRYRNNDLNDLEDQLRKAVADGARFKLISTDGVFSMDGIIADLKGICALADRYGAMVHVDDSHATGFIGARGRGTHEHCGVDDRIDIITGTLGKALGGGSGGFTSGRREVVAWLRQRSRPYLFSNALPPPMVAGAMSALELARDDTLRTRLHAHSRRFREGLTAAGYELIAGSHPIIPILCHEAPVASKLAERVNERGVYVTPFSYPVVPKGRARIRTQLSAALTSRQVEDAIDAFAAAA